MKAANGDKFLQDATGWALPIRHRPWYKSAPRPDIFSSTISFSKQSLNFSTPIVPGDEPELEF